MPALQMPLPRVYSVSNLHVFGQAVLERVNVTVGNPENISILPRLLHTSLLTPPSIPSTLFHRVHFFEKSL